MVLLADAATIWRQDLDRVPNNGDTILISCNESRNTISTEGSASRVSVDAAAVSCPHASTAKWQEPIKLVKRLEASERVPSSGGSRLLVMLQRISLGRSYEAR